jgi:hypothetical protein
LEPLVKRLRSQWTRDGGARRPASTTGIGYLAGSVKRNPQLIADTTNGTRFMSQRAAASGKTPKLTSWVACSVTRSYTSADHGSQLRIEERPQEA